MPCNVIGFNTLVRGDGASLSVEECLEDGSAPSSAMQDLYESRRSTDWRGRRARRPKRMIAELRFDASDRRVTVDDGACMFDRSKGIAGKPPVPRVIVGQSAFRIGA